ncbi:hypothetical protein P7C73_g2924, partial [Tremellales sp. Uapishka_1]
MIRLFSPLGADDARHDEALASRIAALNMLDLTLDHLGLITRPEREEFPGTISDGLAQIVDEIGQELQSLSMLTCLRPNDKADVLVRAHKIVVDGLARLPQVDLRPEGEPYQPTLPRANSSVELAPMDDYTSPANQSPIDTPKPLPEADPLSTSDIPTVSSTNSIPEVVLTESDEGDPTQIAEAMTDSVHTVVGPPISRSRSASSRGSTEGPKPAKPSTSGADLILPIIIYAVVKSNPAQLASQLMYLRRYRSAICLTGEASYAIVNLTAVVEFLEHVGLAELGLGSDSGKVMSIASASSRLRGRVFQVGELAGSAADSANKVLTGVVDSSWTALRGFITTVPANVEEADDAIVPSPNTRPVLRARQASTFSLASVTASVANIAAAASTAAARSRSRAGSHASEQVWGGNQEMIEVSSASRPASIMESGVHETYSEGEEEDAEEEDESEVEAVADLLGRNRTTSDVRSIRSVSSIMSASANGKKEEPPKSERVSLSNRLASASIGVLGRLSSPGTPTESLPTLPDPLPVPSPALASSVPAPAPSKPASFLSSFTASRGSGHARRSSLLAGVLPESTTKAQTDKESSPSASITSLPAVPASSDPTDPPIEKFMTCTYYSSCCVQI